MRRMNSRLFNTLTQLISTSVYFSMNITTWLTHTKIDLAIFFYAVLL